jgi:hypothetical protein
VTAVSARGLLAPMAFFPADRVSKGATMLFTTLFQRLTRGVERHEESRMRQQTPRGRRAAPPPRFVPQLTVLEDRSLPSVAHGHFHHLIRHHAPAFKAAEQQLPFKEHLTVVAVSPTGVITYEGRATYFGRVTATLSPDNTFIKLAANGDTASGYVTHETATTGTVTFTGGTGRFQGISGTDSYVISVNPKTGATTVDIKGTVVFGHSGGKKHEDTRVVPFQVNGGGNAPSGLPLFPGGTAPHDATGQGTLLGTYTGDGVFTLDGFTSATTGTFHGTFVFVAANGDRLAMRYGVTTPGQFTIMPTADGQVVVQFVAVFTPVPEESTGRFAKVMGGAFVMVATTEPFVPVPNAQGYTVPFHYTWEGHGALEFGKGDE